MAHVFSKVKAGLGTPERHQALRRALSFTRSGVGLMLTVSFRGLGFRA